MRLAHALGEQRVGLRAALVRTDEVRLVVVDGIDAVRRHELADLDRLRALLLHFLQLFGRESYVLVLGEFVALDHVRALDDDAFASADVLLFEARAARRVQQVERNRTLCLRRRKELDRDGNHPESDGDRGQRARRHGETSEKKAGGACLRHRAKMPRPVQRAPYIGRFEVRAVNILMYRQFFLPPWASKSTARNATLRSRRSRPATSRRDARST